MLQRWLPGGESAHYQHLCMRRHKGRPRMSLYNYIVVFHNVFIINCKNGIYCTEKGLIFAMQVPESVLKIISNFAMKKL